ncbi:fad binding domain-containing protein [Moniliophthora roreri]|nr:fad binding domain-containing protein [Moniliophthora roreri]
MIINPSLPYGYRQVPESVLSSGRISCLFHQPSNTTHESMVILIHYTLYELGGGLSTSSATVRNTDDIQALVYSSFFDLTREDHRLILGSQIDTGHLEGVSLFLKYSSTKGITYVA